MHKINTSKQSSIYAAYSDFAKFFEKIVTNLYEEIAQTTAGSVYSPKGRRCYYHYYYTEDEKRHCHYIKSTEAERYKKSIQDRKSLIKEWIDVERFYSVTWRSFDCFPDLISKECIAKLTQGEKTENLPFLKELPVIDEAANSGTKESTKESLIALIEKDPNHIQVIRNPLPYYPEQLKHRTISNEKVRSANELVIANALYSTPLEYIYEPSLLLDGVRFFPDFIVRVPNSDSFVIWEHFGMMDNPNYVQKSAKKIADYAAHGFYEGMNLIITRTSLDEGMDSIRLKRIIESYFL